MRIDWLSPCRLRNGYLQRCGTTALSKRAPAEVLLANLTREQWYRVGVLVIVMPSNFKPGFGKSHFVAMYARTTLRVALYRAGALRSFSWADYT